MKGACLCGAVTVTVPDNTQISACHCGMCRRWGGGPLLVVHCGSDVQVEGADAVTTFASSDWAERAFCSCCGTHLYYRLVPANEYALAAGLFQDGPELMLEEEIYIDSKPSGYAFAGDAQKLTEAQVMAKYAPD